MSLNVRCGACSGFLVKTQLLKLKLKALRAGIWFRALPRIDRVIVDLTIRVTQSIRSVSLAESILSVIRKLEGLFESKVSHAIRKVGFPLACKLGLFAQSWGHTSASVWGADADFARYLAIMKMNG